MKEKICQLTCKKHIKIFKLHQLGLTNKEVAAAVGTNSGHVYNVLKDYEKKPEKVEAANLIIVEQEVERSVAN
jgi:transcriptional regulator